MAPQDPEGGETVNAAVAKWEGLAGYPNQSVEEILDNLCRFGRPRLNRMDDGWVCSCEMHVAAAGATFTVRSEFDHKTQLGAVRQCAERVVKAIAQWAAR